MIRTAYNNRFRDHKGPQARGQRPGGRRDPGPRRDSAGRRETSTVVHPWMSLPDRLAAAQAAMRELAGHGAFKCPLGENFTPAEPTHSAPAHEPKPRSGGVNVIIRKRRLPAGTIPPQPDPR